VTAAVAEDPLDEETEIANDNHAQANPTIIELPTALPEELIEPLSRTLARVLVARALRKP